MINCIAFTGTRKGMTEAQKATVERILLPHKGNVTVLHGGCHGADCDFDAICCRLYVPITVYPGDEQQAARFQNESMHCVKDVMPYLVRNRKMVDESQMLIACPSSKEEELRSGTWAMIRYARRRAGVICIYIVWPDGKFACEE